MLSFQPNRSLSQQLETPGVLQLALSLDFPQKTPSPALKTLTEGSKIPAPLLHHNSSCCTRPPPPPLPPRRVSQLHFPSSLSLEKSSSSPPNPLFLTTSDSSLETSAKMATEEKEVGQFSPHLTIPPFLCPSALYGSVLVFSTVSSLVRSSQPHSNSAMAVLALPSCPMAPRTGGQHRLD